jgi:hypothetical protein
MFEISLTVILNHALNLFHGSFQDLNLRIYRDAEPILSQAQHKVQHDNKKSQEVRKNFSELYMQESDHLGSPV